MLFHDASASSSSLNDDALTVDVLLADASNDFEEDGGGTSSLDHEQRRFMQMLQEGCSGELEELEGGGKKREKASRGTRSVEEDLIMFRRAMAELDEIDAEEMFTPEDGRSPALRSPVTRSPTGRRSSAPFAGTTNHAEAGGTTTSEGYIEGNHEMQALPDAPGVGPAGGAPEGKGKGPQPNRKGKGKKGKKADSMDVNELLGGRDVADIKMEEVGGGGYDPDAPPRKPRPKRKGKAKGYAAGQKLAALEAAREARKSRAGTAYTQMLTNFRVSYPTVVSTLRCDFKSLQSVLNTCQSFRSQ